MHRFDPNLAVQELTPASPSDQLGTAVLRTLKSRRMFGNAPGLIRGLIGLVFTGGLWPLISWPRKLSRVIQQEQSQLHALTDWLTRRDDAGDTSKLRAAADRLTFNVWLIVLQLMLMAGAVVTVIAQLHSTVTPIETFMRRLYAGWNPSWRPVYKNADLSEAWSVWIVLISLAYVVHWLHVGLHWRNVRQYVKAFNEHIAALGVRPIPVTRLGVGVRPLWTSAGLFFLLLGAPWGLAAMTAGGLQRRYVRQTGPETWDRMAEAMQMIVAKRAPGSLVPRVHYTGTRCTNDRCKAPLRSGARFCSRCGTTASHALAAN